MTGEDMAAYALDTNAIIDLTSQAKISRRWAQFAADILDVKIDSPVTPIRPLPHASEDAIRRFCLAAGQLHTAHADRLRDRHDTHGQHLRRQLRLMPCLWPQERDVERLASTVVYVCCNDTLDMSAVRDLFEGWPSEPPVALLQDLTLLLSHGVAIRTAAEQAGCNWKIAANVSLYLGLQKALVGYLRPAAVAAIRDGVCAREFAGRHDITLKAAQMVYREAKRNLDDVGEESNQR